jgi:hypothetical protein
MIHGKAGGRNRVDEDRAGRVGRAGHPGEPRRAWRGEWIVLAAAAGMGNKAIAQSVGTNENTVGKWRVALPST